MPRGDRVEVCPGPEVELFARPSTSRARDARYRALSGVLPSIGKIERWGEHERKKEDEEEQR